MAYLDTHEKKWLFMNIINELSDDFIISNSVLNQKAEIVFNENDNVINGEMLPSSNLNLNFAKDLNETESSDDIEYKTFHPKNSQFKPYIKYETITTNESSKFKCNYFINYFIDLSTSFYDNYADNWSCLNPKIFKDYCNYIVYNESKENKIKFGDSPLTIVQSSVKKNKIEQNYNSTLRYIDNIVNSLPIFKLPNEVTVNKKCKTIGQYLCSNCMLIFSSAQSLGGHMSKRHRNQSEKYKNKMFVRNNREKERMLNEEAKRILCNEFGIDYIKRKQNKEIQKKISMLIKEKKNVLMFIKKELYFKNSK